ncbi:MAG: DUF2213 domain-containing protein [Candidatus Bathyarchaeota archaeon]|nr:DUF2213 domain-containing protein [Candidatus Bathyarchaeota archaeon]
MSWEQTDKFIKSGHKNPADFQEGTQKTVTLNEKEGIQAIIAKPKGKQTMAIQSYLFSKEKGWTLENAKAWFNKLHLPTKEHLCAVLPFTVKEKVLDKPLRIEGVALTIGMSRNFNIYTPEELEAFSGKLIDAPVYLEHVSAEEAIGKVTDTHWDGQNLHYTAEIYDEETAEKIRKGLIRHVSVGADYQTIDYVNGKVPHGLYNAEMSLVAVPGIPEANIQILECFQEQESPAGFSKSTVNLAEGLIKKPKEPTVPIEQVIRMLDEIVPNHIVQRSWSLGPQRMCQELNRVIYRLRNMQDSHKIDRK